MGFRGPDSWGWGAAFVRFGGCGGDAGANTERSTQDWETGTLEFRGASSLTSTDGGGGGCEIEQVLYCSR